MEQKRKKRSKTEKEKMTVYVHPNMAQMIDSHASIFKGSRSEVINTALNRFFKEEEEEIIGSLEQIKIQQSKDHHYLFLLIEMVGLLGHSIFKNEKKHMNEEEQKKYISRRILSMMNKLTEINNKDAQGVLSIFYDLMHTQQRKKDMN